MPSDRRDRRRSPSRSRSPERQRRRERSYSDDESRRNRRSTSRREAEDGLGSSRQDDDYRRKSNGSRRDYEGSGSDSRRDREGSSYRRREGSIDEPRHRDSRSPRGAPSTMNAGRSAGPLPSQSNALQSAGVPSGGRDAQYGRQDGKGKKRSESPSAEAIEASKPNFGNSGALAAETNTFKGVVLKYNEPPEGRKPNKGWRLYVFKGKEEVDMIQVNKQSAYLFGRDRVVADIPLDHPSASKQHAVLQYRQIYERNEFGDSKSTVKPYIIDLDSANGTTVNGDKVPPSRYYELQPNDVVKFAFSLREYVLIVDQA